MLKVIAVKIEDIYIPAARRQEIDQAAIEATTKDMLNGDPLKPIKVRHGKGRFVLIEGVNRLEASKAVGEQEIGAYIVQAPKF